jgi:hypothetical protein
LETIFLISAISSWYNRNFKVIQEKADNKIGVYVKISNGTPAPTNLTFTATSETDSGKSATVTSTVKAYSVK